MYIKCLCNHYVVDIFITIPVGGDKIHLGKIKNFFTKILSFEVDLKRKIRFEQQK